MARRFHSVLLVLALWLPAQSVLAHFPAVFGRDFEHLHRQPGEPTQQPGLARNKLTRMDPDELRRYEETLQAAELADGPYAPRLSEPLTALALLYRRAGRYAQAEELYRRALHVERVNDGLLGERQMALVESLLDMYWEQGNLAKLDQARDYHFRLNGSGLPPYSRDRAQAVLDYLRWQREAVARELDSDNTGRLVNLYQVNERVLEALQAEEHRDPEFHRELVLSQLQNLYLILGELPVEEQPGRGSFMAEAPPAKFGAQEAARQRLKQIQSSGVSKGRRLIEDYLQAWPDLEPSKRSFMQLQLGDWLQWNEYYQSAQEHYRAIIADLLQRGETERYETWFATPVELPAGDFFAPELSPADWPPIEVSASFRVSARGNVSNIGVTAARASDQDRAHRLVRALRETHFRPRYNTAGEREPLELERSYRLYR